MHDTKHLRLVAIVARVVLLAIALGTFSSAFLPHFCRQSTQQLSAVNAPSTSIYNLADPPTSQALLRNLGLREAWRQYAQKQHTRYVMRSRLLDAHLQIFALQWIDSHQAEMLSPKPPQFPKTKQRAQRGPPYFV